MTTWWPLAIVIVVGVLEFLVALKVSSQTANLLLGAVGTATLVAIVWYSLETRIIRLQHQWETEVRHHPWLKGSDLKIQRETEGGGLFGRETLYLPITNVGTTPANDLQVGVTWQLQGEEPSNGTERVTEISLPPGDTSHVRLCRIDFQAPGDRVTVDVDITYRSFSGGGGHLRMNFFSHEKGWANGPMPPYEFWLSDGRRFPPMKTSTIERHCAP